jgi:hypothetical protein
MNIFLLLLPALLNVLVTGIFTGVVFSQYLRRQRKYQLFWSIALGMAFLATLFYVAMVLVNPTSSSGMLFFRGYYILGAALMPAWLGLGSVALVSNGLVTRICLTVLYLLSVLAAFLLFFAKIDPIHLSHVVGTPGTGVLLPGPWLALLIILNTLGVIAVVGVAGYSGWKLARKQPDLAGLRTSNLWWANVLILSGDLLNGIAGSLARFLGLQNTFWLVMILGWSVFFLGVRLTSRRSSQARSQPNTQQSQTEKQLSSSTAQE